MRSFVRKNGLTKRLLSFALTLVMVLSMVSGIPGLEKVRAEGTNDLTVHFQKPEAWGSTINAYVWPNGGSYGTWPGGAISENAEHAGWYDLVLSGQANSEINFIFNDGSNQTGDLSNSAYLGKNELWVVGSIVSDQVGWEAEAPADLTVHFQKPESWGSNMNAYVWPNGGSYGTWPGGAISENADHAGWYDLVLSEGSGSAINFIFNDGGNQTADLSNSSFVGEEELWVTGNTVAKEAPEGWGPTVIDLSELKVSDCVKVDVNGTKYEMELYLNGVYEVEVPVTGDFTAEAYLNGEATGVTVAATGEAKLRLVDGVLSVVKKETAAFTGSFSGLSFVDDANNKYSIAAWAPADANAELEYVGGGIYKRTFKFETLAADTQIEYKVAFNDAWDKSHGNGGSNIVVTIPAGASEFTVFADDVNAVVYDSVRSGEFEVAQNSGAIKKPALTTTVSLIGTIRGGVNDWSADAKGWEFTQISDKLFRFQDDFAAGSYQYKCVFDYQNWYEAEAGNRSLSLDADSHVVIIYNTETGLLYDSVNNADTVGELLGMKAAPPKMEVKDNANGTTTFVALAAEGANVTLYYGNKADGKAGLKAAAMSYVGNGKYESEAMYFGDAALDMIYYYDIDGARTLDGSNPTVTISGEDYSNYTRDEFTGRLVCVPGTFPGPSWDAASNAMTYKGNGLYEFTFEDVPAANYEHKIAMGSWDENYGVNGEKDGPNIAVSVTTKQDVTIWYNDFSHNAVNSTSYVFADIELSGNGVPTGTKLTDNDLTGVYAATVELAAGTYDDIKIIDKTNNATYEVAEFTLTSAKEVTFFLDPITGIFYHNGSDVKVETDEIFFDSQDEEYKSVFGAVEEGEEVTFRIRTGADATTASLIFKGAKTFQMTKNEEMSDENVNFFETVVKLDNLGEYDYYFAISNGSDIQIYGDDDGYYGVGTVTDLTSVMPYDLIVYKAGFETPDWMKNAVIYQIFPDRFFDGDEWNNDNQTTARGAVNYEYITDWYTLPENPEQKAMLDKDTYLSTGAHYGDGEWSNEIYGGDLQGIIEKIDYLKALGVNVIYMNPIFASISNHRYDTSDYMQIDPILGDLGDFQELVAVAEANDMHIILDGVFNHVSDDSIYFDRYYKFLGTSEKVGAYPYWAYVYDYMAEKGVSQDEAEKAAKAYFEKEYEITDFSYTEWFEVYNAPMEGAVDKIGLRAGKTVYSYDGWWGYDSMPIIYSTDGSEYQTGNWAEEVIGNEDGTSVTQYWISEGNNGWRLDVANEVSDETWQEFRDSVKALDSEAVIIGEIWDDATKYLMGDMYDSVMNYLFRNAVTGFAMGTDAEATTKEMEKVRERYPEEAFYAMMNLVGSHDTTRILSYLDGIGDDRNQKDLESAFPTYEKTSDLAKQRQYLVAFLQFTYAGAPTIYYGDEIGMVGADDPDDRRAFEWGKGNKELVEWYAKLAEIRETYSALRIGSVDAFVPESAARSEGANVMGYVRSDAEDTLIVLANNATEAGKVTINIKEFGVEGTTLTDIITGATFEVDADGNAVVTVPATNGVILTASEVKDIQYDFADLVSAYDESYVVEERSEVPPADPVEDDKDDVDDTDKEDGKEDDKEDVKDPDKDESDKVETGDSNHIFMYVAIMVCAAAVIATRKKRAR